MGGRLTRLSEGLVIKPRLPDIEGMPFFFVDFLVDVDHIQMLVLFEKLSSGLISVNWTIERTIQSS